jgi:hypothetical protein
VSDNFSDEDFYPYIDPRAQAIEDLYVSILWDTHPALIAGREKINELYCATALFCCGDCNCNLPPCNGPSCPDSGCRQWWTPWWDLQPPCYFDPIADATNKTLEEIRKVENEIFGATAKAKLTNNEALIYSNEKASEIVHDQIVDSTEGIFAGMIGTMLQAGAIGGAIVGATQAFNSILNAIASDADSFLNNVKPYNPGGGLSSGGGLS